jgi:tmRNA-binding protein
VGGHAAGSDPPLDCRIGKAYAILAGWELFGFLATFTLLDNRVAVTSVKLTPLLAHKEAINALFYRCTNHGYHILSARLFTNQSSHPNWVRA